MEQTPRALRDAAAGIAGLSAPEVSAMLTVGTSMAQICFSTGSPEAGLDWAEATNDLSRAAGRHGQLDEWEAATRVAALTGAAYRAVGPGERERLGVQAVLAEAGRLIADPPNQVAARAARWRELPYAEILHLRRIKELLGLLAAFEHTSPQVDDFLAAWRPVMRSLP